MRKGKQTMKGIEPVIVIVIGLRASDAEGEKKLGDG
jgi:hypothetical protein